MKRVLLLLAISMTVVFYSCKDDEGEDVGGQSSISGTSHNTGRNCMGCHQFTVAGSVYNKALSSGFAASVVTLTSNPNGEGPVLGTFTTNKSGSFYSSNAISFGSGVYVTIASSSGIVKHMNSTIVSGACNSCHGSSTSKIWTE